MKTTFFVLVGWLACHSLLAADAAPLGTALFEAIRAGDSAAPDPIDRLSSRPDFALFIYPGPLGVPGMLPADAPPAFLLVADDDETGAAGVITTLLERYREAHVPVEAHVFAHGRHAFNMGNRSSLVSIKAWPQRMADWLADSGLLSQTPSDKP